MLDLRYLSKWGSTDFILALGFTCRRSDGIAISCRNRQAWLTSIPSLLCIFLATLVHFNFWVWFSDVNSSLYAESPEESDYISNFPSAPIRSNLNKAWIPFLLGVQWKTLEVARWPLYACGSRGNPVSLSGSACVSQHWNISEHCNIHVTLIQPTPKWIYNMICGK